MNQDIYVVIEHLRGQVAEISFVMLAGARELVKGLGGGNVVAVLLGHKAQGLAGNPSAGSGQCLAADKVLSLDHPALADFTSDAYQKVLSDLISKDQPRAVLFGSTSIGTDLASTLSIKLGLPMVSSCRSFSADGKFVSQICGGKIMAEGDLPGPTALVTMVPGGYKAEQGQSTQSPAVTQVEVPALESLRVTLASYIEPESGDVDIAKEPILVSVGRGIQNQDNISLAEDLAKALGAVVSGSRPVIDQGWLETSRLVGKSGKHVKPKIYLALGISGAPEHAEAITDSDTIIAINTDPTAPIFNIAKYGAEIDLFDLVEVLTAQVKAAKGS
ncbi:MAG: electron transfer flavoprotein subunit alpha/FixB family protein [Chloroflexi bacterium]|nr:electron transfer flavoprotein subunit alpha/FixB family protein [Chloroflexota bacterium]